MVVGTTTKRDRNCLRLFIPAENDRPMVSAIPKTFTSEDMKGAYFAYDLLNHSYLSCGCGIPHQ